MERSLTTELTSVFVVSINGASPETVTAALTLASSRVSLTVASLPTFTTTLATLAGPKLGSSADTE